MKVAELKEILTEMGIEIPKGTKKPDLEKLLEDNTLTVEGVDKTGTVIDEKAFAESIKGLEHYNNVLVLEKKEVVINGLAWVELKLADGTTTLVK